MSSHLLVMLTYSASTDQGNQLSKVNGANRKHRKQSLCMQTRSGLVEAIRGVGYGALFLAHDDFGLRLRHDGRVVRRVRDSHDERDSDEFVLINVWLRMRWGGN